MKDPFDQCFVCSSTSTSLSSLSQRLREGPQEPVGYSYASLDVSDGKHWKGMKFLGWINTNNTVHRMAEWAEWLASPLCVCRLTGQTIWSYQVLSVKNPAMSTVNIMALSISVSDKHKQKSYLSLNHFSSTKYSQSLQGLYMVDAYAHMYSHI